MTLALAFWLLLGAGGFGAVLAALHLRGTPSHRMLGAAHGVVGAAGLFALVLALRGPPRGVAMGVASFGAIAAGTLALALLAGLAMPLALRRVSGAAIGVHATIAVSGIVILAAYVLLG